MKHFVAIVETGSFTRAAARTAVSQPALSSSMAKLEAEFGAMLLDRRGSRVVATAAGERLFAKATDILRACNSVKDDVLNAGVEQIRRIGVLETIPSNPISRLISFFRRIEPNSAFEIFEGSPEKLTSELVTQRLVAILTIIRGDEPALETRPLFKERFVLAVPPGHRFAKMASVNLGDLDGEAFISRNRCEQERSTAALMRERGVKVRVTYRTDHDERALSMVAAGVGVAFMPEGFVKPGTVIAPVADFVVERTIALQWLPVNNEDAILQNLIAVATSHDW